MRKTMRKTVLKTVLGIAALLLLSAQAEARPSHHRDRVQQFGEAMAMAPGGEERVVGGRPAGCPNAFCGCEASLYKFGRIVPGLNLASNWRRFPRATPAPGMAAVRSGHVMILESQVAGDVWTVHDGNSGGHVTREHPRSLAGYTIVDPSGATGTFASGNPGMANARYGSPAFRDAGSGSASFTNASFSDNGQGTYRHAGRSARTARAYGAYAMMR
jgi:hypothetical protein